jgi:heterotetrameric sarcosine oxidase gamma subunit
MADRVSALDGHYTTGRYGKPGEAGVYLQQVRDPVLQQVAAWPESIEAVGSQLARQLGINTVPGPSRAVTGNNGSVLRTEPLKWWLVEAEVAPLDPEQGVILDLSHSRTRIRISGEACCEFLNRHLSLDFREHAFPVDSVASSVIDHVGVTLWHSPDGYELFIPRGYARFIWQGLLTSAEQFGVEVI